MVNQSFHLRTTSSKQTPDIRDYHHGKDDICILHGPEGPNRKTEWRQSPKQRSTARMNSSGRTTAATFITTILNPC
jgi:hypothetical protein